MFYSRGEVLSDQFDHFKNVPGVLKCIINHNSFSQTWGSQTGGGGEGGGHYWRQ